MFKRLRKTAFIIVIILSLLGIIAYREFQHTAYIQQSCEFQDFALESRDLQQRLDLLTRVINSESHGENLIDKLLVGSVVINRMRSKSYPRELEDVIYSRNQFSGINSRLFNNISDSSPKTIESKMAALILLQYGPIDSTIIYFINPDRATNTDWKRKLMKRELVFKNDKHYFYR